MANQARPRVFAQRRRAAAPEAWRVRVHTSTEADAAAGATAADARAGMAHGAVPLDVATDARIQVALRFPAMVPGAARTVGPHRPRRVEAPALGGVAMGTGHRDAGALVAGNAEALLVMTAGAGGTVLAGCDGMQIQPVIRMHAPWPDAPIVTIGAVILAVAVGAKPAVRARDQLVAFNPIGPVLRMMQPARWLEPAARELGLHDARAVEMTRRARSARFAAGGVGHLVATEAAAHARHVIAGREIHVLYGAVALRAANVAFRVRAVIEVQVRCRHQHAIDAVAVFGPVSDVARFTAAQGF